MSDHVIEVFSSVQGEGKYVGYRQVFVRFADCNLRCSYCDTDFRRAAECRVECSAGSMVFDRVRNPIALEALLASIARLSREVPTHSVSLTGGEPLLHVETILAIAERLDGMKIFLETNGTLPDALERVLDAIDIVSMDVKLPRLIGLDLFDAHREFMRLARRKDLYVKLVVDGGTTDEEFRSVIGLISTVDRSIPLIIQPVTPIGSIEVVSPALVLGYQRMALERLADVRVIPQTHRVLSVP